MCRYSAAFVLRRGRGGQRRGQEGEPRETQTRYPRELFFVIVHTLGILFLTYNNDKITVKSDIAGIVFSSPFIYRSLSYGVLHFFLYYYPFPKRTLILGSAQFPNFDATL